MAESEIQTDAASPERRDIRSARSRMRTKYGSQRQILELAGLLGSDEKVQLMAVADGPSKPHRHNHGLMALTDRRLLFVPTSSAQERLATDLDRVRALVWTKGLRSGVLSVVGEEFNASFSEVSSADCREIMALIVRTHPHVKRVGHL